MSERFGFMRGAMPMLDTAGGAANWLSQVPGLQGVAPSVDQWLQSAHADLARQQAAGVRPGVLGEVAGTLLSGSGPDVQPPAPGDLLSQPADYVVHLGLHRMFPGLVGDPGPAPPPKASTFGFAAR
jgi:hypothetical protein